MAVDALALQKATARAVDELISVRERVLSRAQILTNARR